MKLSIRFFCLAVGVGVGGCAHGVGAKRDTAGVTTSSPATTATATATANARARARARAPGARGLPRATATTKATAFVRTTPTQQQRPETGSVVVAATATETETETAVAISSAATAAATATSASTIPRGGACSDSNPALFAKIGLQALVESAALLGILLASVEYADVVVVAATTTTVFGEPLLILLASFLVVFGSSLVGAVVGGGLSAASNQALNPTKVQGDPDWYAKLQKPSWNPPGWLFPIMWLIVSKPTQLCATSRIFKYCMTTSSISSSDETTTVVTMAPLVPLAVYTTMLALGNAWNKVFFGLECIGWGTVVITLFYAALLASAVLFYQLDAKAGYYMLPTCAWVTVATALQYSIYFLNKGNNNNNSSNNSNRRGGGKPKKRV